MDLKMHLVDDTLPLPAYQTEGAIGFDLYARETTTIAAKSFGMVPVNLIVQVPKGHGLFIFSRSGTPKKKGLMVGNGVGVIDQDYCGPEDELKVLFFNVTEHPVTIERAERCAQALVMPIDKVNLVKAKPAEKSRGGFGSTGA